MQGTRPLLHLRYVNLNQDIGDSSEFGAFIHFLFCTHNTFEIELHYISRGKLSMCGLSGKDGL